jgi:hypothetical protein
MLERFWTFAKETTATLCCLAVERARHGSVSHSTPPRPEPPTALSLEERWVRATGAVTAAIASFGRIETLQSAAVTQIDAADYTLQHLLEELSLAMPMPMPADGSALRELLETVAEREEAAEKAKTLAA